MIAGLLWLFGCQLVGELIARLLDLPVPGPIIGMLIFFVVLRMRRSGDSSDEVRVADYFLDHLQLLFIPAGVGAVAYVSLVADHPVPLLAGLLVSWLAGLLTVGWLVEWLSARTPDPGGASPEPIE